MKSCGDMWRRTGEKVSKLEHVKLTRQEVCKGKYVMGGEEKGVSTCG